MQPQGCLGAGSVQRLYVGHRALLSVSLLCDRFWDHQDNPILKCHTQSLTWAESFCFLPQNYHLDVPWFAPLGTRHAQTGYQRPSTSLSQTPHAMGMEHHLWGFAGVSAQENNFCSASLESLTSGVPTVPTAAFWSYTVCSYSLFLNVDGLQENWPYSPQKYLL